jgi:hypothetical protein
MAKTAMNQLEDQVELIRREAYAAGYAAATQAIRETVARPARAENDLLRRQRRGAVDCLASHSRLPARPRRARRPPRASPPRNAPNAGRIRGWSRKYCELAPRAVRPGEIRAAVQRDKGLSLAYTSIRHALGQLEGRKAVQQDGSGWRMADRGGGNFLTIVARHFTRKLAEGGEAGRPDPE